MPQERKPYDLLLLLSVEFLITIITFYTGVIMLFLAYGATDAQIADSIRPGASTLLMDNPRLIISSLGWLFSLLTAGTILVVYGLYKAKRFSYLVGMVVGFLVSMANIIALMAFGLGDLQLTFRLLLGIFLPLVAMYYLSRPSIKKYLLV